MTAPDAGRHVVLVVHGVANRDRERFETDVARVAQALAPRDVRPVWWGDLGAEDVLSCLPTAQVGSALGMAAAIGPAGEEGESVASRAVELVAERSGEQVPSTTATLVREVLEEAAADGHVRAGEAVADALADAVVLAGPAGTARLVEDDEDEGVLRSVRRGLRGIVDAVDRGVDRVSQDLTAALRERQAGIGRAVARTVGDILVYDRRGEEIRRRLDDAYREAAAEAARVDVMAHSLGGLVTVEWLLGAPVPGEGASNPGARRVDTLVTFGAQVSLFCELHGLLCEQGLTPTTVPVEVPLRARRWFNVWHALDPLAFVVGPVVRGSGADAVVIEDLRLDVEGPLSLGFHSGYWRDERFLSWLAGAL